jgi:hypothetical protein
MCKQCKQSGIQQGLCHFAIIANGKKECGHLGIPHFCLPTLQNYDQRKDYGH